MKKRADGVYFVFLFLIAGIFALSFISSTVDCITINVSAYNNSAQNAGGSRTYTSSFLDPAVNFSIKVWTEDLNYNITCYNSTGVVNNWSLGAYSNFDERDLDDAINYFNTSCVANKVYVFVKEGGSVGSSRLGYNITYRLEQCTENCNCAGIGCGTGDRYGYWCDGCDYIRNTTCSANITSAYWKNGSGFVSSLHIGKDVNLTIGGIDLAGQTINYKIYNSTNNALIYTFTHNSLQNIIDQTNWTANILSPSLYFNATLVATGQQFKSGNLFIYSDIVAPPVTRVVPCNGTKPVNASWNVDDTRGNFTQTLVTPPNGWSPAERYASYNTNPVVNDEYCTFKCDDGYLWNGSSCLKIPTRCEEFMDRDPCNSVLFNSDFTKASVLNSETCGLVDENYKPTPLRTCRKEMLCNCTWISSSCQGVGPYSNISECDDKLPPPEPTDLCSWKSTPTNNCNNSENNIKVKWEGTPLNSVSDCPTHTETYNCESEEQLGFFDYIGFIVAVLAIACIYFFRRRA